MKHLGLFEGIGGFSLAARWAGWETVAWCEINPFCQKVLKHHFPEAEGHTDIKETDFKKYAGTVDIITGGFPCQPYSTAGKRKGKEDDRHLWPQMLRAIREVSPRWVVGENVRGLTNWNGGLVFDEVQADLEAEGYEVLPFLLPACAVNAPHRRDRIWFVAHAAGDVHPGGLDPGGNSTAAKGSEGENQQQGLGNENRERLRAEPGAGSKTTPHPGLLRSPEPEKQTARIEQCDKGDVTNSDSLQRCERGVHKARPGQAERHAGPRHSRNDWTDWQNFPTQSPVCSGDDELPRELDGITFSKWRNESIKAYGNAIVPRLFYEIALAINEYERVA